MKIFWCEQFYFFQWNKTWSINLIPIFRSIDLCKVLEPHLNVRQKEDLANLLLHVLHDFQKARDFLEEIVMLGNSAR